MQFKKFGKILARIVPVICVVALVVSLAAPASAAELIALNYEDYVESVDISEDGKIFHVSLPLDKALWGLYDANMNNITFNKNPFLYQYFNSGTVYNITCNFFGLAGYYLDCSNIPKGTSVTFNYQYSAVLVGDEVLVTTPSDNVFYVYYVDKNNNIISTETFTAEIDSSGNGETYKFTVTFALNAPKGAAGCRIQNRFQFQLRSPSGTGYIGVDYRFDVTEIKLNVPVDNYYLMVQQNGKQTELLGKIEDKLEEQGQSLDDILDEQKETNDKLDDTNDKLDDLNQKQDETNEKLDDLISGSDDENEEADQVEEDMDDTLADLDSAGDALDSVDRPEINTEDLVPDDLFGDDYLLLVDTIKIFWTSDIITNNLTIMAGFILLALVIHGKK